MLKRGIDFFQIAGNHINDTGRPRIEPVSIQGADVSVQKRDVGIVLMGEKDADGTAFSEASELKLITSDAAVGCVIVGENGIGEYSQLAGLAGLFLY